MTRNIKVSVIIPIFNVEAYLDKCLDSVVSQTLCDIEIICIDDGSTDQSGHIADSYAKRDSRVRVVHKGNSGYGNSMNIGIDLAKGEYIGVVESDDYVSADMYEKLYSAASENMLDFVKSDCYFCWDKFDYRARVRMDANDSYYNRVLESDERNRFFSFFMNIWTGIYSREFLIKNRIRFNETPGASFQDNGFWIQTMTFAKRCMWLDDAFYYYNQDNENASIKNTGKVMAMDNEYKYALGALSGRSLPDSDINRCIYYRLVRNRGSFFRIADSQKKDFLSYILEVYNENKQFLDDDTFVSRWYSDVRSDPESYYNGLLDIKNETMKKLNSADNIFIYGAGAGAESVFRLLLNNGYGKKIRAFVVSSLSSQKKFNIGCIPIIQVDDCITDVENDAVVISVEKESKHYVGIKEKILEKGWEKRVEGDLLFEVFYSIF